MFDEKTEALAKKAGLEVWFPARQAAHLRRQQGRTRCAIGDKAGVPCVPNVLGR